MRGRRSGNRREVVERVCAPEKVRHIAGICPEVQWGQTRRVRRALEDMANRRRVCSTVGAGIVIDLADAELVVSQAAAMP